MPTKSYTPISGFWFLGVPAVMLGLGYYMWNSHGFIAMEVREALSPIVYYLTQLFAGLV
jgi:hypothetical protein